MQPQSLSLDPAANLWSSNSPSNNLFTQSPDAANDVSFGLGGSSFYAPNTISSVMSGSTEPNSNDRMPNLTANSTSPPSIDNTSGEVFMGVSTPQPGGIPSWKWTVMSDKK